jgi:hypothetical protein
LASTAQSGVESQQDDAGICAELVLVRLGKAAHQREQDADVQAPPHFLHVRMGESFLIKLTRFAC